jgi:hypothetical protein
MKQMFVPKGVGDVRQNFMAAICTNSPTTAPHTLLYVYCQIAPLPNTITKRPAPYPVSHTNFYITNASICLPVFVQLSGISVWQVACFLLIFWFVRLHIDWLQYLTPSVSEQIISHECCPLAMSVRPPILRPCTHPSTYALKHVPTHPPIYLPT